MSRRRRKAELPIDKYDTEGLVNEINRRFCDEAETGAQKARLIAKDFDDLREKALENSEHCYFQKKSFPKLNDIQKKLYLYFATAYENGKTCWVISEDDEENIRSILGIGYGDLRDNLQALTLMYVNVLLGNKDAGGLIPCADCLLFRNIMITWHATADGKRIEQFAMAMEEPLLVQMMHNEIPRELWLPAYFNPEWRTPFKPSVLSELLEKYTYKNDAEDDTEEDNK